ncbi:hypothetical protein CVN76_29840 [Bacillus sp. mrc49]|nr:hypothetical protein CVN76_29840 [Bacillus sp. mrc49]
MDFYLSESRDKQAAKRFIKKALAFLYVSKPRVIKVDKGSSRMPIKLMKLVTSNRFEGKIAVIHKSQGIKKVRQLLRYRQGNVKSHKWRY